jgi:molecular chaperone DnaK
MSSGFELAVDFGTSNTAAVLRGPDGRIRSVMHDGSPVLPSAVCLEPSGRLLVGKDALAAARMYPGAAEPHPKRCVDDGVILLGGHSVPVDAAIGAVLSHVAEEARRTGPISRVVLTYPAAWGPRRKAVLAAAAARAGLPAPILIPEPLAAAARFVHSGPSQLPVGACLLVYDFGAGTFDASVVRRTENGFDVLGSAGLPDAGGLDVDAAVVANLGATYANRDPQLWQRLAAPGDDADQRARRQLWDDVRVAKESLSRASSAVVHVPGIEVDAPIGREQLDRLAMPVLQRTVTSARATMLDAGLAAGQLGGVLLVGGSSRIPLVATLLHRAFGVPPTVFEQPELVVAEGALAAADAVRAAPPAAPEPSEPPEEPTAALTSVAAAPAGLRAAAAAAAPSQGARRRLVTSAPFLIAAAVVLVLALGAVAAKVIGIGDGGDGDRSRIGSGPGSGQWAGAGGVVSGSPVPGASGSATPSTAASGTAKPNATAASPTRGGTTGGGSTGGGTSTQTSAPASGDDTKASTIRCTSYRKLSLTRVEGSGGTTPTFEIRGCIWKNNSQVSFSYDYRMDTARKTGYQFYPLGMYKCDADLLSNLGQHSGSGTIAYDDGEISAGGVKRGQATSYHGQGDFQVSVTDDAGNKWSTNGTAVTLRTLCLDE